MSASARKCPPVEQPGHPVDSRHLLEPVGLLHEIGNVGVDQHAAAVGQRLAIDSNNVAVVHADVAGLFEAGADFARPGLDVGIEFPRAQSPPAADDEAHETLEIETGDDRFVGQMIEPQKRAIDEPHPKIDVQEDNAELDLVERRTQRINGLLGRR